MRAFGLTMPYYDIKWVAIDGRKCRILSGKIQKKKKKKKRTLRRHVSFDAISLFSVTNADYWCGVQSCDLQFGASDASLYRGGTYLPRTGNIYSIAYLYDSN